LKDELRVSRDAAFQTFVHLIGRCGSFANYLVKREADKNFFGGDQEYVLFFPVDLDRLTTLSRKYEIPFPTGAPSNRWFDGFVKDADGWESCNDDIESHQAGDDTFCSLADVIDLDSFAAHVAGEIDRRQSVAKGYLRLRQ